MTRYGFTIKTRHGPRVGNMPIMASTQVDAVPRPRQMYHHCEILDCRGEAVARRNDTLDVESVIGMISAADRSPQKAGTH